MATMPFTPCSSNPCTDVTVNILQTVFGPVIKNLTLGTDPSGVDPVVNVIATMMGYFNSGVLTVATLIVSFVTVVGVINTANDGEAFGKNWSSLWTPVRIVSGAAVLLPTGTGYSFIQLMVMMFSLWAVGFANGTFEIGVKNGIIAGSLQNVSQKTGIGAGAPLNKDFPLYNMREIAAEYMNSAYCAKTLNKVYAQGAVSGLIPPNVALPAGGFGGAPDRSATEAGIKTVDTYEFKDRNAIAPLAGGNAVCGTVSLYKYAHITPAPVPQTGGLLSKVYDDAARNANNEAISLLRDAVLASKLEATKLMMGRIDNWISTDWPEEINENWSSVSVGYFNEIVDTAQAAMLSNLNVRLQSDDTLKKMMDMFAHDIIEDGWAMAGGYYQRLSGIREELRKIYAESPGLVTQPALGWLPNDAKGDLVRQSMTMVDVIARKAIDTSGHTPTSITDTSNIGSIIPSDLSDIDIDQMGSRGNKVLNSFVGNVMEGVTNTAIGADGSVDAMARIKTVGDLLAVANSTAHGIARSFERKGAIAKGITALGKGVPFVGESANAVVNVVFEALRMLFIDPLQDMLPWLDGLAFYFGVFLPSLPYTIFIIAVVGWFLAVLQTVFAAPLWAVMHMTPDRTFVGSQTQGYLMFLSLFMRPVLIIAALFAAMLLANPIILYVSKAFWAMRTANVSSAESIGFYVQFLTWKNWLIMYGMILLPVVYMIYGLTNTLPDAILTWIGAGIKPLGETQAAGEMRQGMEKHGAARGAASALADAKNGGGKKRLAPAGSGGGAGGAGGDNSSDNKPISDTGQAGVSVQPDHVPSSKAAGGSGNGSGGGGKSNAQSTGFSGIGSALPPDHDLPKIDYDWQGPSQGNDSKVVSSSEVASPSAEANAESRSSANAANKNEGSKSVQFSRDAASVNEGGDVRRSSDNQDDLWGAAQKDSDEKAA